MSEFARRRATFQLFWPRRRRVAAPRSVIRMLVVEHRQAEAEAQGDKTRTQAGDQREDHHQIVRQAEVLQADIQPGGAEGDAGVDLFLENQRDTVAEHVAQHPAEDAGDHCGDGGDNGAVSHIQGHLRADDREDDQADGVEHQEQAAQMAHQGSHPGGDDRRYRDDDDVFRVFDPAQRKMPEQHIAHRPAADRRDRSDDDHAEHVHLAAAGRQRAGHGFGGDADDIKDAQ